MKKDKVMDIETLCNLFSYSDIDINTKEINQFVIHKSRNQLVEFIEYLSTLTLQIGFNNKNFDGQVIQYIIENYKNWDNKSGDEIARIIYQYAQYTINLINNNNWPDYAEWKFSIPQIDLFKIWHFDNRQKMVSLKWIEYMLDMENIEEIPIHHGVEIINDDQIKLILDYNKNDILTTFELYKITIGDTNHPLYKEVDKIQLRKDIQKEFNINCINYNDVKIGDDINKISYCTIKQIHKNSLPKPDKNKKSYKFSDCFPSYIEFKTDKFKDFVSSLGNVEILDKKQEFIFKHNETSYCIAKGGIHSEDKPRIIKPKKGQILRDIDCGSMYPNAISKRKLFPTHLGEEWLIVYETIIQKRIEAKKQGKKSINEALKLSLNGGSFGKMGEENNWQYDPYKAACVTIGCQMDLLMLIETLSINGIKICSANTDGLTCLFDNNQEELFRKLCKDWEIKVGNDGLGKLEEVDYKLFVQTSVNDYIAIKTDDKIKTKGDFVSDFELHKNKSARIIPLALQQYFINNIPVTETIKNHSNIFDFCLGVKSIGKNRLYSINTKTSEEIKLQKVNRYYISNNGINLIKRLPKLDKKVASNQIDIFGNIDTGIREAEINAGYLSTIYNRHIIDKRIEDYDINYDFYINSVNKIIEKIIK